MSTVADGGLELVRGSGNVFRDFGLPDADLNQARCILAAAILKTLDSRQWSTRQAEAGTGVSQAEFACIRRVKLGRFSLERLAAILGALGQPASVTVDRESKAEAGEDQAPH